MSKLTGNVLPGFSVLFIALSLAACGGGGGSSSSDDGTGGGTDGGSGSTPDDGSDPVAVETVVKPGIFTSTITESGEPDQSALALLSSTGEYAVFSTETQAGTFGRLTFQSDDTFSEDVEEEEKGTYVFLDESRIWRSIDGSLKGSAASLEEFTAAFTGDAADSDVDLSITGKRFNALSDQQLTMEEDLNATYSMLAGEITTEVNISLDGSVTGSDTTGCVISGPSGAISIPDPAYNIFEGTLSFTECPPLNGVTSDQRNGDYQIVGYIQSSEERGKELVFAGTNDDVRSVFIGTR
ncbi:hypothetical protein [Marinobacter orientalis]|uniref:Uncharacterized protein n=1 Tax=Marinobacter orientalis TaxID=1928859 RepID=A0A7Y0WSB1_9GAMM|nr:hypothetical protein [Marinobacter orientalis]NMT63642.1 hypothetical protein [Marinobacter orientalis]TGX49758.1 hypothetical protein DIT72_08540 [Marinobacter orientalis]